MNQNIPSKISFLTLKGKEVINAGDGTLLGRVVDIELEQDLTRVKSFLLPPLGGRLGFSKRENLKIPISQIERIGQDVILVRCPMQKIKGEK